MEKKRRYPLLLIIIVVISIGISAFDRGKLFGIIDLGKKGSMEPTDELDNLFYTQFNYCTTEDILERSGFAFKNNGNGIVATEFSSGISVPTVSYETDQVQKYSEYVSYIYTLVEGQLYRSDINGKRNRVLFKQVVDYELMGDYLYFIQLEKPGISLLDLKRSNDPINTFFRSRINGGYKEELFDLQAEQFWASSGNLLIQIEDENINDKAQNYFAYSVINQESFEHQIDTKTEILGLDANYFYTSELLNNETIISRRAILSENTETLLTLPNNTLIDAALGSKHLALLYSEKDSPVAKVKLLDLDTLDEIDFQKQFGNAAQTDYSIDISTTRVYVTDSDNLTVLTLIANEDWNELTNELTPPAPSEKED